MSNDKSKSGVKAAGKDLGKSGLDMIKSLVRLAVAVGPVQEEKAKTALDHLRAAVGEAHQGRKIFKGKKTATKVNACENCDDPATKLVDGVLLCDVCNPKVEIVGVCGKCGSPGVPVTTSGDWDLCSGCLESETETAF